MTDHPLARFLEAYPALPSGISEDELLRAVAAGLQARPCVCGGVVVADVVEPTNGVLEHQATERHARWRAWVES